MVNSYKILFKPIWLIVIMFCMKISFCSSFFKEVNLYETTDLNYK